MIHRLLAPVAAGLGAVPAALWILRHERRIRHEGRRLHARELQFARQIGIRDAAAVRILTVPQIPSPLGGLLGPLERQFGFSLSQAAGVTLGYGIYVAAVEDSFPLVAHELVHVRQYESLGGPLAFIRRYFHECLAVGYHDAPLEIEARRLSRDAL